MRKWWCLRCKDWVSYDPREVVKEQALREHDRWCGLDILMPEQHADLVELDRLLTDLYPVED